MIIKLAGQYKSLNTFESDPLAKFTVIVGKNGSGKSQLVEVLSMYSRNKNFSKGLNLTLEPAITKIQIQGIENSNLVEVKSHNWIQKIENLFRVYQTTNINTKELLTIFIQSDVPFYGATMDDLEKIPNIVFLEKS